MHVEPQEEHRWLQKLVGEWTFEAEASMGPDHPPHKMTGKDVVRSLGGVWVLCEGEGDMGQTIMTLGYDPARKKFVGTFIGSMMTFLWVYEGTLNSARNTLTLDVEGPSFDDEKKMVRYQDIVEFRSDDHRTLSSQFRNDDGTWNHFMTAHYHRKK